MPTRYAYPVDLLEEDDGVTVTFPDVPEAITCGDTCDEALDRAVDCLETALAARMAGGEPIPPARAANGRPRVAPGALMAAKAALHEAMRETGTTNVALARALGVRETEVRRMRDPKHGTRIDRLEMALAHFGRRVVVSVESV